MARILIVDDHPVVRLGLREALSAEADLEVCGVAESASEALEALEALDTEHPELMIVDLSLPGRSGLELIKEVRARGDTPKILVHSIHSEKLFAQRVLKAGAQGFVSKEENVATLLAAIRRVLSGEVYLSEEMTQQLLQLAGGVDRATEQGGVEALSDRELEVFALLAKAASTREIAERLNLSVKTIETYRENIKSKLGLETNNELIRRAVAWWLEDEI